MSTWRQEEGGDETLENAGEENSEPRFFFTAEPAVCKLISRKTE